MNARMRLLAALAGAPVDRAPFMEFMGYWPETIERWHAEGLPGDVRLRDYYLGGEVHHDATARTPQEYFGLDGVESLPIDFNFVPAFEPVLLKEDAETKTVRDEAGVTKIVFKNGSAMPHYIEFPIRTRADFEALKPRLDPMSTERYPADWNERVARWRNRDTPLYLICRGPFAFCRDFMKFDDFMLALSDDPEWIAEMMTFHTDFLLKLWERAASEVEVDFIYLGEDMAMKGAPMISPAMFRRLIAPLYKRIAEFLRAHGIRHFIVDSDGNITQLLPAMVEAGVTGILPVERTAGCDPLAIRREFPTLAMIGGVDKLKIAEGGAALRSELDDVVGALVGLGRYIPSFDHSVHPLTPLTTYREYLARLREVLDRAGGVSLGSG